MPRSRYLSVNRHAYLKNAAATRRNFSAGFTVSGIETLALTSTAKDTVAGVNDTSLKAVTSVGAGTLTMSGFNSAVLASFDASTATGAQKIDFSTTASDVAVKGGSVDDFFTFGGTFTSKDTVDGGTGSDSVSLVAGDYRTSASDVLKGLNALTSVENIVFTGAATTAQIDQATLTNTGITKLVFNGTNNLDNTVTNATSTTTYAFGATHDEARDAHIFLKAGNTTLNLALEGVGKSATVAYDDANVDFLELTGALTVNIKSTGVNDKTFATATALTDFNDIGNGGSGVVFNSAGATFNVSGDANTRSLGSRMR